MFVEIDDGGLKFALAREGEQSRGEARAHFGGLVCAADQFSGLPRVWARLKQLMVADNDGQQVVEVMGDATSQLAEGIHALSFSKRLLLLDLLRHVAD